MTCRIARVTMPIVMVLALAGAGCRSDQNEKGGSRMPQRDIMDVQEANAHGLMAQPGVVGVAIGETDGHKPCIIIYIVQWTDALHKSLPKVLEGYPVRVEESGEIRPLGR